MRKDLPNKPNILYVMMDDMGYGDMQCYGSRLLHTPVMDSIAESGVKFNQMYSPAPICSPARCGFLTGRYPQKAGIPRVLYPEDEVGLGTHDITIGRYLQECGYSTSCIGKWHLGCREEHFPTRHGFDDFFGLLYSNDMSPLYLYRNEEVEEQEVDQATLTRKYSDEAIRFIRKNKGRPFFCYLAHTMPHIPLHVEKGFKGKSLGGTYGDTIECIDYHLGRIMQVLRELGLEENTLVIVTSDNGPWFEGSTGGLRGLKFECYEGGIRMPFVAQWKGVIPPGSVCDKPAIFLDLLPTFVGLAGDILEKDRSLDGCDILDFFLGTAGEEERPLYFYFVNSLNAVRLGKWKLHVARYALSARDTKEMPQLFNLEIDPSECYNLADRHPELVEKLTRMINDFDGVIQPVANTQRSGGKTMSLTPFSRGR